MVKTAQRIPRDVLLAKLLKIADEAAQRKDYSAEWWERLLNKRMSGTFRVSAVYVAGSWARGALECGDLDIVVAIEGNKLVPRSTVSRLVVKGAAHVQMHLGTPEDNSSFAKFAEAQLVWSPERPDVFANLADIRPDPLAGRFNRPTDSLPLRLEQVRLYDLGDAEQAVTDIRKKRLSSAWIALPELTVAESSWSEELRHIHRCLSFDAGRKTKELLPIAMQYLCDREPFQGRFRSLDRASFKYGASSVFLGRPPLYTRELEKVDVAALVLIPHRSHRGPNGVWVLRRGPKHAAVQEFAGIELWTIAKADGRIAPVYRYEDDRCVLNVELFTSAERARKFKKEVFQPGDAGVLRALTDRQVLEEACIGDCVTVDDEMIALTDAALAACDGPVVRGPSEVAAAIRAVLGARRRRTVRHARKTRGPAAR
jgi:hypothetical protein